MPDVSFDNLLIVAVIAFTAPLIIGLAPALRVVRGVPAMSYQSSVDQRRAIAAGLLQATSLPFIVTATEIGLLLGEITPVTAAGLVSAGLISVILFPPVALALLKSADQDRVRPPVPSPGGAP